jgi:hypothetical protein
MATTPSYHHRNNSTSTSSPSKLNLDINGKKTRRYTLAHLEDKEVFLNRLTSRDLECQDPEMDSTGFLFNRLDKLDQIHKDKSNLTSTRSSSVESIPDLLPSPKSGLFPDKVQAEVVTADYIPTYLPDYSEEEDSDKKSISSESSYKNNLNLDNQGALNADRSLTSQPLSLAEALPDWDFWCACVQVYGLVARHSPHLLITKIRLGIPSVLRRPLWQVMCQSNTLYVDKLYEQLINEPMCEYDRVIKRDVPRTFPTLPAFEDPKGQGQTRLYRILKAYSLYDAEVGYCQGLGFMVGPLLLNLNEKEAFAVMVRLMDTYDLRGIFTSNMEGLKMRLYQLSYLICEILPNLGDHLSKHNVHPAQYASPWFLSLFSYNFPLSVVQRIYDVIFAEGAPETILRVALALLQKNERAILEMDEFEDIITTLCTDKLFNIYEGSATKLIEDAIALSPIITTNKLDEITCKYQCDPNRATFQFKPTNVTTSSWFGSIINALSSTNTNGKTHSSRFNSISSVDIPRTTSLNSDSQFFLDPKHLPIISANTSLGRNSLPSTEVDALRLAVQDLTKSSENNLSTLTNLQTEHQHMLKKFTQLQSEHLELQSEHRQVKNEQHRLLGQLTQQRIQSKRTILLQQEHIQLVEKKLNDAYAQIHRLMDEKEKLSFLHKGDTPINTSESSPVTLYEKLFGQKTSP